MPTEIPDLWGDDINVDVVPPLVILKAQAEAISRRTRGMLTAEVVSSSGKEKGEVTWVHGLHLRAPTIEYGELLLTLSHDENRFYPVSVELPEPISWAQGSRETTIMRCDDQQRLLDALSVALTSPPTKWALSTLLAKVNEAKFAKK